MEKFKTRLLPVLLLMGMALVLIACGSSDSGGAGGNGLSGTYVIEGEEHLGITLTFSGNNFTFTMPYAAVDPDFDMPGNMALTGTFTVNESDQVINLRFSESSILDSVTDMIDALMEDMMQADPDFAEAMNDPEMAALVEGMMDAQLEMMQDYLLSNFDNVYFTFDGNFDRLYDEDGSVFVRQ